MLSVIYLLSCIVVGFAGRRRRFGFAGFVLLSLFLTPVLPLLYLLFTQKRFLAEEERRLQASLCRCPRCAQAAGAQHRPG